MSDLETWRLSEQLSVVQATLLTIGIDPSSSEGMACDSLPPPEQPRGYAPIKTALTHAVRNRTLPAVIRRSAWERGWDEEPTQEQVLARTVNFGDGWNTAAEDAAQAAQARVDIAIRGVIYHAEPDWHLTTVRVADLAHWLQGRGLKGNFFVPADPAPVARDDQANSASTDLTATPGYLDPKHPRYAYKLDAAIKAWLAFEEIKGKSTKDSLEIWLKKNAKKLRLVKEDDSLNIAGIEECAKVANWKQKGGAPKTPD